MGEKKKSSLGKKVLIIIAIFFCIGTIMNQFSKVKEQSLTPQQLAEKQRREELSGTRFACKEFLLKVLNDPDSAKLDNYSSWYVEKQKDGLILVQPTGRAKNSFGAYIRCTWNCTVSNDGKNIRLVSLKQIAP